MRISDLSIPIVIEEKKSTVDKIGNSKEEWIPFHKCHAAIRGENGREVYKAGDIISELDIIFIVRHNSYTSRIEASKHRVIEGGDIFNIIGVDRMMDNRRHISLRCVSVRR